MVEFVRVEYTGTISDTGEVFDTTKESGSRVMVVGAGALIKGFENTLAQMKAGEEKTITLKPSEAYGERDPMLVKLVPMRTFLKNNVAPYTGMVIALDNQIAGKVQSVSGGRVRVDFNHTLAGKTLTFRIKMIEKLEGEEQKLRALLELSFPVTVSAAAGIKKQDSTLEISLPKETQKLEDLAARKVKFVNDVKKLLGLSGIKITEEY